MLLPKKLTPVLSRFIRHGQCGFSTGTRKSTPGEENLYPEIRTTDDQMNKEAEERGRLKPEWSLDFIRKVLTYKPPSPAHPDGSAIQTEVPNLPKITIKMWQNALVKAQVPLDKYERLSYADREVYIEHLKAVRSKKLSYTDPRTKHSVFTVLRLLATGDCCGNGCRHCPYGHKNAAPDVRTTTPLPWIQRQTLLRVVDNSKLGKQAMLAGKPPLTIHVYRKGVLWRPSARGQLGDKVLVTVMGEMKKGYIVGHKTYHKHVVPLVPRFDSNNVVLLDDAGNPLGTRILVPIPYCLRGKPEMSKILAIATRFV